MDSEYFQREPPDDGHIVPQYALGWEICCHRSGVKGRFEQIAKQAEAKRQESEEMVARNMESDDEKKDSKTVVIPKEVKSPEPSQNKIEQEHTVALVVTPTDQTMAESIGEEKKESTQQVEKKEEPKVQDNEILCENNGREECIIDTRIQHFPPHDNAPTKSTSLNTASSTGHPGLNLCSDLFELGVFLLVHGPDDHTCENRKGGESKILGRSLRSEQGVTVNEKQTRKGMRGRTNIDALLMRLDIGLDIATSTGHSLTGQDRWSQHLAQRENIVADTGTGRVQRSSRTNTDYRPFEVVWKECEEPFLLTHERFGNELPSASLVDDT
ncbi:hypothetical protein BLNAU_15846 [Blattamonas nauphoetae]|uniref:Uncharacterized protein n=1 Tax=Blattamonas nauphoetae TaxID=2049346 RepID=A0ABQ9X9V7_9EUKA|nr:hypothetical protein BLNAU_15846 [Blattamonas nauphoetae]